MTTLTLTARGTARPEVAWERYAQPALWPTWSPQIWRVEAPGDRIAPGSTGTVRAVGGVPIRFTVLTVDEASRTWTWRARLGPVVLTLDHAVQPDASSAPDGSATELRMTGPAPVVYGYAPLARLALGRLVTAPRG